MANWTTWKSFTPSIVERSPTTCGGVYEIALDGQRLEYDNGWSNTIYYGQSASSIRSRLQKHISGRGNPLVRELVEQGYQLKVRWWVTSRSPSQIECGLFERFSDRFGELPAGNSRGCDVSYE